MYNVYTIYMISIMYDVLRVYTLINVFIVSMLRFYQNKNYKSSRILL